MAKIKTFDEKQKEDETKKKGPKPFFEETGSSNPTNFSRGKN